MTQAGQAGRIGITGGSGFIGSCVADRMTTAGSDVVVLDTRPPQRSDVAYRHVDVLDLAELVQATRDLDAVFHLAGLSDASDALARPVDDLGGYAPAVDIASARHERADGRLFTS